MRIRLGTRASPLALAQAKEVAHLLKQAFPRLQIVLRRIRTKGDVLRKSPLPEIGGKGLFTKEIERALLRREIDAAVHALKDLPTKIPRGLCLSCLPRRRSVSDFLVSKTRPGPAQLFHGSAEGSRGSSGRRAPGILDLPRGARVGTSSLRRQAQILSVRPDLRVETIRGNVGTRLKKLESENWDAVILAEAGLERLGLRRLNRMRAKRLSLSAMLPAPGQGALGIETRRDDTRTRSYLQAIHHEPTTLAVRAERAFMEKMEGGCRLPLGAYARVVRGRLKMDGLVAQADGKRCLRASGVGSLKNPKRLGERLAKILIRRGAREIMKRVGSQE